MSVSREQDLPTDSPEPLRRDGGQTAAEANNAGEPAEVAARPDVYDGLDGNSLEVDALAAATDLSGRTIGQYRVEARLGGGAMAAVYRAYDQILERPVAIKLLLPGADAVMRERFRREARTVSTLDHPHIVRTIQVGQAGPDGLIYIAMELVEGVSLADLLEQHGTLSPRDACLALEPIARALAYAHQQGVVHRDVKPSNILLQRAAPDTPNAVQLSILPEPVIPLLSDFGIARALDAPELTSAGRTIGTPAFMAPEQCAGLADIDGRADIYSLGAVLYRCLVGRPPYSGTTTQILHAHVYDPLLLPEDLARTLPPPVLELLTRSMMKEPAQRYPQVELMAQSLAYCVALFADADVATPPEAVDEADPTMTMAALPAARLPTAQTSRILVPAPLATPRGGIPARPRPVIAPAPRQVIPPQPVPPRRQGRSSRLGALILAAALVILV
ncbi:MAG TPA: serine/threonine-protein kinase, partial [Caldilineaceae bacterium]|nr:serine/threonine-protein kinase [Caldilineaceae bacterium]